MSQIEVWGGSAPSEGSPGDCAASHPRFAAVCLHVASLCVSVSRLVKAPVRLDLGPLLMLVASS